MVSANDIRLYNCARPETEDHFTGTCVNSIISAATNTRGFSSLHTAPITCPLLFSDTLNTALVHVVLPVKTFLYVFLYVCCTCLLNSHTLLSFCFTQHVSVTFILLVCIDIVLLTNAARACICILYMYTRCSCILRFQQLSISGISLI